MPPWGTGWARSRRCSAGRSLARGLAPLDEQAEAFQNGLAALAAQTEQLGKAHCRLDCSSMQPISDRAVAGHLYRIAQEAVHNAVKHSGAKEIVIKWEKANGAHRLEVSDNGRGLINGNAAGLGLKLMSYRAGIIGADLKIRARAGGGVTVSCVVAHLP
jgi:signal transduction histidine kinase